MAADGQLILELDVCAAHGVSHSHFLGGPPVWTADDRDKAVWRERHRLEACPSCGTHPDRWDPAQGGDLHMFEASLHHCRGCEVSAQGQDWLEKREKAGDLRRGTTMRLTPTRR